MLAIKPLCFPSALQDRSGGPEPADGPAAEPSGGQDMHGDALEQARKAGAAFICNQQHAVAAAFQLRGQRMRRNHMAAGSTGSEYEIHADRLSPLHFTT